MGKSGKKNYADFSHGEAIGLAKAAYRFGTGIKGKSVRAYHDFINYAAKQRNAARYDASGKRINPLTATEKKILKGWANTSRREASRSARLPAHIAGGEKEAMFYSGQASAYDNAANMFGNPLLLINPMTKGGAESTLAMAQVNGTKVNRKKFDLLLTEVYIATTKGFKQGLPEGHFYAKHMMGDDGGMERFNIILALAVKNGLIESHGYLMKATPKLIKFVEE